MERLGVDACLRELVWRYLKRARFDLKKRFRLKIQELEIFKRSLEITLTEDYLSL